MSTNIDEATFREIARGEYLNLKAASQLIGVAYLSFRKRVYRENLPIVRLRNRVYIHRLHAADPRLRIS